MGKKTLYHPVSLHAIRGALEFCGWRIERLHQAWSNPSTETAGYSANLVEMPEEASTWPLSKLARRINDCFSDDIVLTSIMQRYDRKSGKIATVLTLAVDIHEITPMEALLQEKAQ